MSEKSARPSVEKVFLIEEILPCASSLFEDKPLSLDKAIEDADIVLDTNVLLIPYGAGQSSLTQIVTVYGNIKEKNRLFIPAQVAREFVKNRPLKLAQLYQGINDQVSKLNVIDKLSYPILDSVDEFNSLNESITQISELKSKLKSLAKNVRLKIKDWGINDPVSQAYRNVFTKDVVFEPQIEKSIILDEMLRRYEHSIPPGYKDASKPDAGIGDYLIWKAILSIGEKNKRNVIFVSGDEKADWLHGVEGSGFITRYELQAEFKQASGGKDLYLIPLSRLLELKKAEESTVVEVKFEEVRIKNASNISIECPECNQEGDYELSESIGSSALPLCQSCGNRFHLHRTREGISTRIFNSAPHYKPSSHREKTLEKVACPSCGEINLKELGVSHNSTAWCICDECEKKFPIHRRYDNSVYINSSFDG
ncbi:PIN domain-containing protein [Aeromonas caviae]|uniref:PIN domain-containing protein n=1 Tax=Aeromonas caviae TaxID=648 RepID=UPI002280C7D7|nr:PIN domain-containing protein [Aeromonas caviae]MCY9815481.1 PIN domain-containing protein [Aeromonas caviae]